MAYNAKDEKLFDILQTQQKLGLLKSAGTEDIFKNMQFKMRSGRGGGGRGGRGAGRGRGRNGRLPAQHQAQPGPTDADDAAPLSALESCVATAASPEATISVAHTGTF